MWRLDPFQDKVLRFIQDHTLISPGDHILAAVSGGPDSVALLDALSILRGLASFTLSVAHFDHGLRGEASRQDALFVESLARSLDLPSISESRNVNAYRALNGVSMEMAARACRHEFFKRAMHSLGASRLATGHSADDQAEEILLRLMRGTGPSGLAGMAPKNPSGIIRPILSCTRREIGDYIKRRRLSYRLDASNDEPFCQRNALRLDVFPVLERVFHPEIARTISRHAELACEEEDYWSQTISALWPSICVEEAPHRVALDCRAFGEAHPAVQRRVLRFAAERLRGHGLAFYAVHVEAMRELAAKVREGSELHLPAGVLARISRGILILSKDEARPHDEPIPAFPMQEIHGPGAFDLPSGSLVISWADAPPETFDAASEAAFMDAESIRWPLRVRGWLPGDRFQPMGLKGSKKLQDLFTDLRIPKSLRGSVPLLCDSEKICWVVGFRMDERVKVTPNTRRTLIVRLKETR